MSILPLAQLENQSLGGAAVEVSNSCLASNLLLVVLLTGVLLLQSELGLTSPGWVHLLLAVV